MRFEFDESEHLLCAVDDTTFWLIDRLYGRAVSEKFLYPKPREPAGDVYEALQAPMGGVPDSRANTA